MSPIALGLMSGTSADGISAVAADFKDKHFRILGFHNYHFPAEIPARIRKGPQLTADELSQLNVELGEAFANAANQLMKKIRLSPQRVTCIGSHGQTIYHGPRDPHPNTIQIGEPAVIAERTKVAVVSHFRQRDLAAGGEGAPLIPFFEQHFFGEGPIRAFQNLGGIANVTVVGKNVHEPLAFDTGPGNSLMDEAVRIASNGKKTFDQNGTWAREGVINYRKAEEMMREPYFFKGPPKSTGLEKFGRPFLLKHFGREIQKNPKNVLATLNYFTCLSIQESYRQFVFPKYPIKEMIVSGGGSKNTILMKNLRHLFNPIPVKPIETLGIPTQAKEPLAFAFLGLRTVQHKINHLPETTGAEGSRVLGSITFA